MKINEIEAGEKSDISSPDLEPYFKLIEIQCSDALSAMQAANTFMKRGIKNIRLEAFHGRSRNDRKPAGPGGHYHNQIKQVDEILSKNGFTALRSNSIFVSASYAQSTIYVGRGDTLGGVYLIFPKNGFSFTWAEKVQDLLRDLPRSWQHLNDDIIFNQLGFKNTDLVAALESNNEILIHGEYYAFSAGMIKEFEARFLK